MMAPLFSAMDSVLAQGGPVVLLLGLMSVLVLSVSLAKLWQFLRAGVGCHRDLQAALLAWDGGDAYLAQKHLAQSRSYLREVVEMAALESCDAARLGAEAETRFARLERGFRFLDTLAQLAPLLGLFGTVLGMITAFRTLQEAGTQVDPSLLAGGIWVALLTTAVGLAVAMPTALILSWFEARMDADRVFADQAIQTVLAPRKTPEAG